MPKKETDDCPFGNFSRAMDTILRVSHDELKAQLDAEKLAKKRRPKKVATKKPIKSS